jgi:hypothetical protein
MKHISVLMVLAMTLLAVAGCASFSTVNPRAMSLDDIIALNSAGTSPDVIKEQIKATGSRFTLSPEDIIRLKNEKVPDEVVQAMLEPETHSEEAQWNYSNPVYPAPYEHFASPYDFWHDYYFGIPPYDNMRFGYPYMVYRQPGLIGRFYTYRPIAPPFSRYGANPYRWRYESAPPDSMSP